MEYRGVGWDGWISGTIVIGEVIATVDEKRLPTSSGWAQNSPTVVHRDGRLVNVDVGDVGPTSARQAASVVPNYLLPTTLTFVALLSHQ